MSSEIKTIIFGSEIPGNVVIGQVYGRLTTNGILNIKGLQCTVNGSLPVGSALTFYMQLDGITELAFPITVANGANYGYVSVFPNIQVYDGTVITFLCSAVGSTVPGSWCEIRMNVESMVL